MAWVIPEYPQFHLWDEGMVGLHVGANELVDDIVVLDEVPKAGSTKDVVVVGGKKEELTSGKGASDELEDVGKIEMTELVVGAREEKNWVDEAFAGT
jgi:hypothetical protein